MDPATLALFAVGKFFEFLCTPAGQKFADQVFKDGQDVRAAFEEWTKIKVTPRQVNDGH